MIKVTKSDKNNRIKLALYFNATDLTELKLIAQRKEVPYSQLVRDSIKEYVKKNKDK